MNSVSTSVVFVITLNCCDHIVCCVAQLHIRPAAFSVQPEITTAVCPWRVCSQGDFASRRRGLGVNTHRRSGRPPSVIRQAFHRDCGVFFSLFSLSLRLTRFFSREHSSFAKVQRVEDKFSCSTSAELAGSDPMSPVSHSALC